MHAMLRDLFGMHEVKEDNCKPQPGDRVMKNTLLMMRPIGVIAGKSMRSYLKRQTNHFMIKPDIANLASLYICTI
jgi:hypothetical protein